MNITNMSVNAFGFRTPVAHAFLMSRQIRDPCILISVGLYIMYTFE